MAGAAPKGPQPLKFPGKDEGLVRARRPAAGGGDARDLLDDDTTPIDKFFIRNNGQIPEQTSERRRLEVHGRRRGRQPLELTLGELK